MADYINEDRKKELLDKHGSGILKKIGIDAMFMAQLVANKVLTYEQSTVIQGVRTAIARREALKCHLYSSPFETFINFCIVLHDEKRRGDILKELNLSITRLRREKVRIKSESMKATSVQPESSSENQLPDPQSESSSENQLPGPQPETSSGNQLPCPQPESSSENQLPGPQPETSSGNQLPDPQPETSSGNQLPDPQPESISTYLSSKELSDPQPESGTHRQSAQKTPDPVPECKKHHFIDSQRCEKIDISQDLLSGEEWREEDRQELSTGPLIAVEPHNVFNDSAINQSDESSDNHSCRSLESLQSMHNVGLNDSSGEY